MNLQIKKKAYSISEAAEVLGVRRPSIYNLINAQNGFPCFKVGGRTLISVDGLDRWITEQTGEVNQ